METVEKFRFINDARWNASLLTVDFSVDIRTDGRIRRILCRLPRDVLFCRFAKGGKEQPLALFNNNLDAAQEAVTQRLKSSVTKDSNIHLLVLRSSDV